jgi:hypothetical protein
VEEPSRFKAASELIILPKPYTRFKNLAYNLRAIISRRCKFSLIVSAIVLFAAVPANRSVVVLFDLRFLLRERPIKTTAVVFTGSLNSTYARRNLRTTTEDRDDLTEFIMTDPSLPHKV